MFLVLVSSTSMLTWGLSRSCQARSGLLVSFTCDQTLRTAGRVTCVKLMDDLSWAMESQLALFLRPLYPLSFTFYSGGE